MFRLCKTCSSHLKIISCGLLLLTGCASGGSAWTAWNPFSKSPDEIAVQKYVAAQQNNAKNVNSGQESSIYPPQIVDEEPLPRTEKDLKNPLQLHLSYAKLQEQIGHITEARSSYEKVISSEPKSVEAIIGLGRIDALAGRHEQAEQRFRQAVEVSQSSPEALFSLGQYMASRERYTEAIVELQKASNLLPQNAQYKYELGLTLARARQYDQARQVLNTVMGDAEACYNLGYVALKEQGNQHAAEEFFTQAVQLDPELKPARYWLAQMRTAKNLVMPASATSASPHQIGVLPAVGHEPTADKSSAIVPVTPPSDLTPEQWQQWQNQQLQ